MDRYCLGDIDTHNDLTEIVQSLNQDDASMQEIARMLLQSLSNSLHTGAAGVPHTTHNHGIFGTEEALNLVQDTLEGHALFPTTTSTTRLLCGRNALEMAIEDAIRILRRIYPDRELRGPITTNSIMGVLFTNFDETQTNTPDEIGEPSAEYQDISTTKSTIWRMLETSKRAAPHTSLKQPSYRAASSDPFHPPGIGYTPG